MQLEAALKKRETLSNLKERLTGTLEAAKKRQEEARAECQKRGIDPDNLDNVIKKLETAFSEGVSKFSADLEVAETNLKPFAGEQG
jgi:uncharacterized protein YPO0396